MDHHAGRRVLDDPGVVGVRLFVRHRLLAALPAAASPSLVELVTVPVPLLVDHHGDVAHPPPEDELAGRFVELNHDVGVRPKPPEIVPGLVELQVAVVCAEPASVLAARQDAILHVGTVDDAPRGSVAVRRLPHL